MGRTRNQESSASVRLEPWRISASGSEIVIVHEVDINNGIMVGVKYHSFCPLKQLTCKDHFLTLFVAERELNVIIF